MCTSIILIDKGKKWPVIIGSNRDENLNRKFKFPARHWLSTHPNIIAAKDEKKGGSWIGINDFNIFALIHNRKKNNNIKKYISRGKIILEILKNSNINNCLKYIKKIDILKYDNFNLLFGNSDKVYWVRHQGEKLMIKKLDEGISVLTENDLNNLEDDKINFYYNIFSNLEVPEPSKNKWLSWTRELTNISNSNFSDFQKICFVNNKLNYGTKSSTLLAIPKIKHAKEKIVFKSTKNFPNLNNYKDVQI